VVGLFQDITILPYIDLQPPGCFVLVGFPVGDFELFLPRKATTGAGMWCSDPDYDQKLDLFNSATKNISINIIWPWCYIIAPSICQLKLITLQLTATDTEKVKRNLLLTNTGHHTWR
jgi:hypothetical protein